MVPTSAPHRAFDVTSAQIDVVARAVKSVAVASDASVADELEDEASVSETLSAESPPPHDARSKLAAARPATKFRRWGLRLRIILITLQCENQ